MKRRRRQSRARSPSAAPRILVPAVTAVAIVALPADDAVTLGQGPGVAPRRPAGQHVSRSARQMIKAVLFDIDGTLLVTGGAGAVAWQRAFRELHGIDADIEEHTHAGMTDPEIAEIVFREVIGRDGSEAERAAGDRRLPQSARPTRSTSPTATG